MASVIFELNWNMAKAAGFDFEASGTLPEYALQPWRYASGDFWTTSVSVIKLIGKQLGDGGELKPCGSKLFPEVEDLRNFLQDAIDNDWYIVGWNLVYDVGVLLALGLRDLVYQLNWIDGMLLWKHLEIDPEYGVDRPRKRSYALKPDAVQRFIPQMAGYEENVDFHSRDPENLANLQKYNDRDSVAALVISHIIWGKLTEQQRRAAVIESAAIPLVAEANLHGMPVHTIFAEELSAWLKDTAAKRLKELEPHGLLGPAMVRSNKQLAELLFDVWKLPVLKETSGGKSGVKNRSTDKETLHELAFMDPRCKLLRDYRESLNNDTKFATAPLVSGRYNGDNRTRPQGIIFGTYSGRMTYASKQGRNKDERQIGFALHQEKRGKEYRGIICAPDGYSLVEFDAAGQEFRWMAALSGDTNMLHLCQPGEDAHSFMGSRIVGCDYHDLIRLVSEEDKEAIQKRYLGKFGNLSCQYRIGAKTLRVKGRTDYDIPIELPEAQRILTVYKQTYPSVPRYWDDAIALVKRQGYAETLAGRRVQVVGDWGGSLSWKMGSTALNYPIQGTGADQKYLAMAVLRDFLIPERCYFAWDLHDGLYWWVPDAIVDRIVAEGKRLLDNLPYKQAWNYTPPIPMPFDAKLGKVWGALKEHK